MKPAIPNTELIHFLEKWSGEIGWDGKLDAVFLITNFGSFLLFAVDTFWYMPDTPPAQLVLGRLHR
ncbi:hypothetical protein D3C73_1461220 [compost metagenome]